MRPRLLVVDWDFFFPMPQLHHDMTAEELSRYMRFDWSTSESAFFIDTVWDFRGLSFLARGEELPLPNDEWRTFWSRFNFSKNAVGYCADSNVYAIHENVSRPGGKRIQEVWLYDAHHDSGYSKRSMADTLIKGTYTCENWMAYYHYTGAAKRVVYPKWKTKVFELEPKPAIPVKRWIDNEHHHPSAKHFDLVFVCRSGAWVPSWCDDLFQEFLDLCPVPLTMIEDNPCHKRGFNLPREEDIKAFNEAFDEVAAYEKMIMESND